MKKQLLLTAALLLNYSAQVMTWGSGGGGGSTPAKQSTTGTVTVNASNFATYFPNAADAAAGIAAVLPSGGVKGNAAGLAAQALVQSTSGSIQYNTQTQQIVG